MSDPQRVFTINTKTSLKSWRSRSKMSEKLTRSLKYNEDHFFRKPKPRVNLVTDDSPLWLHGCGTDSRKT